MSDDRYRAVARRGLAPLQQDVPEGPEFEELANRPASLQTGRQTRAGWLVAVAAALVTLAAIGATALIHHQGATSAPTAPTFDATRAADAAGEWWTAVIAGNLDEAATLAHPDGTFNYSGLAEMLDSIGRPVTFSMGTERFGSSDQPQLCVTIDGQSSRFQGSVVFRPVDGAWRPWEVHTHTDGCTDEDPSITTTELPATTTTIGAGPPPDASIEQLAGAFAACPDRPDNFAPPSEYVASATSWMRLEEVRGHDDSTQTSPATVIVQDHPNTSATEREVRITGSYWPGIEWALANGGEVWLAMADPNGLAYDNIVAYVLVLTADGRAFFPGDCQHLILYEPLRQTLGDRFDEIMRTLPWKTGNQLSSALAGSPCPVTADPVATVDIDGDGHADEIYLEQIVDGTYELTICGPGISTSLNVDGANKPPGYEGVLDIDGDGHGEIFYSGAYGAGIIYFATTMVDGILTPVDFSWTLTIDNDGTSPFNGSSFACDTGTIRTLRFEPEGSQVLITRVSIGIQGTQVTETQDESYTLDVTAAYKLWEGYRRCFGQ
ncbi:MAG: hypothetical protein WBV06_04305 [Acidimicrobiia bacterium]